MPANLEYSAIATRLEKVSFHSSPKECLNYRRIALISHTSKVMLKILQARLQPYMNCELSDVQAGFRKGRGTRDQIANIHWIIEKARENTCYWGQFVSGVDVLLPPVQSEFVMGSTVTYTLLHPRILWSSLPGRLQSTGSQRVRHDWLTSLPYGVLAWDWVQRKHL